MEKVVKVGILFDFYGKLLSDRQYTAIELYYIYDLSLSEIGENLDISRQAVYDTLKRAEANLEEFEEKLKLVGKFADNLEAINKIETRIEEIEKITDNSDILEELEEIRSIISKLLKSSQEVGT